ncbi:MAG TPA: glycosyltransferase [Polyangia bacterium]|jgi:glycosyltransferase involved in cell wall biosynthesis|nr:glycosyltransferase [Polyangia bacterium]
MTAPTVLYLVDGLGLSGKTKAMVDLACGLDPARYQAAVARLDVEDGPLVETLRGKGIPLHDIPCPAGLNLGVLLRLGRLFRQVRPTVVHCYNPRTMLYGGIVARTLGIRSTLGSLSAFACLMPDVHYEFLPQRLNTASSRNRLRNRVVARLMRAVVTVSRSLGEQFCRFNGIDTGRLRVISYGVDVARFGAVTDDQIAAFRDNIGVPRGAVVIGSVGRLVEQKDYPTQLRGFAHALAGRPASAPELWMVLAGDGPLRASLEALAAELGIGGRVRFIGHNSQVPVLLRSLDVFVISSKFEPYGVALLEAKASGVAIAATAVNEIPELVPTGEMGLLVPSGDWQALGGVFARLCDDEQLRRSLGARAAADAGKRHSLTAAIDGYQKIYDETRQ